MSIVIHFATASTLLSPSTVPPAPACVVDAESLEMGPGLENDSGLSIMSPDDSSMVDVSTSDFYSGKEKVQISGAHHTLGSCFGLPYQDHNYGAPPPPTPPSHSPPMSPVHVVNTVVKTEPTPSLTTAVLHSEEVQETSITRCVCGFDHDDEYMICCDRCLVWQHVDCMGLDRSKIPETYLCEKCEPRKVDRQKAKVLQAKKKVAMTGRKLIFHETSDESEDDQNEKNQNSEPSSRTRSKSSRRKTDDDKELKTEHAARKGRSNSKHVKERMEIKRSKFRRRTKSKSESACVGDEEAQDAWRCSADWPKKADYNSESSNDVQNLGATLRSQTDELKSSKQLQAQLCRLVEFAGCQKKLVAATNLARDQIIIEFKGQFLSATQFHQKNPVFRQKQFPFVLFYKLRSHEELCVDASENGNEARFVRRSCMPNAEIRHLVSNGALHLYISSIKDILEDEEITIPFDVNFKDCLHEVECACSSDNCFIMRRKTDTPESSERKRRGRRQTQSTDDDSNQSLASSAPTSPVKSTKSSPIKATSPTKVAAPVSAVFGEQNDIRISSDDHLTEHMKEQRKKMTREERKLDAIMRAFDQMEKAAKRKKQALDRQAQQKALQKTDDFSEKQETVSPPVKEEEKQIATENSSSVDEEKPLVATQPVKHKKGKRRRGSGTPVRRRTRTNSGGSDIFNTDDNASNCDNAVQSLTSTPSVETAETVSTESADAPLTPSPDIPVVPVLPKTKRFLHNEWLHEKESTAPASSPLTVRAEVNYNVLVTTPTCYVRCTKDSPSASGISAAHLRRSSFAGHSSKPSSNQGSAKKRWLRQAMHDYEPVDGDSGGISMEVINGEVSSPSHADCFSPINQCEIGSPGILTSDEVVTPLKKRRLLRKSVESMSSSDWLGASSEMSPDHSSCDSTAYSSADSNLVTSVNNELKNSSAEKSEEKCSVLGGNGLSQHLLKTLRENWIKNDNKSRFTDPSCTDDNAQNNLDGSVDIAAQKSVLEVTGDVVTAHSTGESQSGGPLVATHPDSKTLVSSENVSTVTKNSTAEKKDLANSESCSVSAQKQSLQQEMEGGSSHVLNSEILCTKSLRCSSLDNVKDLPAPSAITDSSNRASETLPNGFAITSSFAQELSNKQNDFVHAVNIGGCNTSVTDLTKTSKELNSASEVNGENKSVKEDVNAQDTIHFQKHSSIVDSVSVNGNSCDTSTTSGSSILPMSNSHFGATGAIENNTGDLKLLNSLSTTELVPSENSEKRAVPSCGSATQKRKVSLSEYRQRKRENATAMSGSIDKKKSNNYVLNTVGKSMEKSSTESEIKLAALPLFESIVNKTDKSGTEDAKSVKKKERNVIVADKACPETRENLSERLKREFGLEEEADSDKMDTDSSPLQADCGMLKAADDITPILTLCTQLPPPPPPPPPGTPLDTTTPTPSQFAYPMVQPYGPQPYVVPQITSTQYLATQTPMVPQIIPVIHPLTAPPSVAQPSCNYSATMQTTVSRPPQPTYPVVNNQNYAVLAQPHPHATLQPTYHPLFKSQVYK